MNDCIFDDFGIDLAMLIPQLIVFIISISWVGSFRDSNLLSYQSGYHRSSD